MTTVTLRDYWPGHGEPRVEVIEDDRRVAGFATESEARAWCALEYGEDWDKSDSAGHILTRDECTRYANALARVLDHAHASLARDDRATLWRLVDDMQQGATDGADVVAAYLAHLESLPLQNEFIRRIAGNVRKLQRMT